MPTAGAPSAPKRMPSSGPRHSHLHLPHLHLPSLPHALPTLPGMHLPGPSAAAVALRDAKQLRRAMVEFYRGLGLLSGYATMNATAITKILKKHDKCTGALRLCLKSLASVLNIHGCMQAGLPRRCICRSLTECTSELRNTTCALVCVCSAHSTPC